ncbi:MAG: hypothetical protein JO244_04085 [Solirubrobacterales bacterium]|nr:hypothetical protein [Solirubrobacterales bacterium]
MSRRLLTRGWALVGCACFATITGAASCSTAATSGTSVAGTTLTIYQSVPPGTASSVAQDVLAAERLALKQSGVTSVGKYTLKLVPFPGAKLSDTARQAIGTSSTIAYLGEIAPGDSAATLGITNAEDVLQVSPTDTALELTQSSPAISNTPAKYYESKGTNGQTFARMVPTSGLEAKAVVAEMRSLGVNSVYVAQDGSEYGKALAYAFAQDASGAGLKVTQGAPDAKSFLGSGADALFLAASSGYGSSAASLLSTIGGTSSAKLFVPSGLALDSLVSSLPATAQKNLYVSSPGFTPSDLPAAGQQFDSAFRSAYGRAPVAQAIFGYAAMAAVIHALQKAGSSAGNRSTVVHDFLGITNLSSAIGQITFDKSGDVSFAGGAPFVFSRVRAGKLVPVTATHE